MSEVIKNDSATVNESTDVIQMIPDNLNNYSNGLMVKLVKNVSVDEEDSQSLSSIECDEDKLCELQQDDQTYNQESINHKEVAMETEMKVNVLQNDATENALPRSDGDDENDNEKDNLSLSSSDDDDDILPQLIDNVEADSDSDAENPKNNKKSNSKKQNNLEEIIPTKDVSGIFATEAADLKLVGRFKHFVKESNIVVIESVDGMPGLNLETILFRKDKTAFGEISDVIGPVVRPFYLIKFSSSDEITAKQIQDGEEFFYIPNHTQWTKFIFADELNRNRGTDASWIGDEEAPDEIKEYSDDEEEKRAKKKPNTQKAVPDSPTTSWPPPKKIIVPKRQKKAGQNLQQPLGLSEHQGPPDSRAYSSYFTSGPVPQMSMANSYGPMGGQPGPMGGPQGFGGGPYGPMGGPQGFMGGPYGPMGGPHEFMSDSFGPMNRLQGPTNRHMMYQTNTSFMMAPGGVHMGDPNMIRGPHNQQFSYGPQNQGHFRQPMPPSYNPYPGQSDPRHRHPSFGWY